ncbi:ABC transporter substrate-binding protein [Geotalea uraniireducens]|uniref:ABC-type uncharacterized transport system periplasmic component-like protein n=1 Tax=Geotalea uraniireducens (strain Rf4) TaxID=351605 RepID=A5GFF0_GEOUR|nr:ABC transporter substrate binding protein [Geotalea uraniireducens]ABQ26155.1 ABC-type uncharacterized transport system periplasmic component-like protein [Geotalea uraniireducens Rf4]
MAILRALLSFILALYIFAAAPALATDLLIVQSTRHSSYTEALNGFRNACNARSRVVVLDDYAEVDVARLVREEQPVAILAVGDSALDAVKKIRRVPIVSLMSISPSTGKSMPPNVTGVRMTISPERYMTLFNALRLDRVGVIYNTARSGAYLRRARQSAEQAGVDLVLREVDNPRETSHQLASLKGKVDALWLLPDSTAVTRETVEAYFFFSMEQRKPVIAFSAVYLSLGAAATLEIDRHGMGMQAGEVANRLLKGASPAEIPFSDPLDIFLKTNPSVIRKLELNQQGLSKLTFEGRD